MTREARILVLPGRGSSGPDHWQSHWEAANPSYERVQQDEWDNPVLDAWLARLNTVIQALPVPTLLIAHSLSVSLVAHWASRFTGPVAGALLVAPSDVESPDYPVGTSGFAPLPLRSLGFPAIVIASSDDPRVSVERARQFAGAWGARFELAGAYGHLGSASLLADWSYGRQKLAELAEVAGVSLPGPVGSSAH
ncbi:RBBP9/YdeN family alpha/beta hydrolase [Paraburkholderia sp. BCC1886]|uniref:RBBP9/YdeN family alpha/beta hydrolase n=1 Tax=Paraburkholderia sp. BCC1886 TaxID=2562670 RepID=UPI001183266B|nr:alpha/beta hydrolase [Paraburkholderia sp. BCC1886]